MKNIPVFDLIKEPLEKILKEGTIEVNDYIMRGLVEKLLELNYPVKIEPLYYPTIFIVSLGWDSR
jgi:hypothetical protein